MEYANTRIASAHDYSGEKVKAALAVMEAFNRDANSLYRTLTPKGAG